MWKLFIISFFYFAASVANAPFDHVTVCWHTCMMGSHQGDLCIDLWVSYVTETNVLSTQCDLYDWVMINTVWIHDGGHSRVGVNQIRDPSVILINIEHRLSLYDQSWNANQMLKVKSGVLLNSNDWVIIIGGWRQACNYENTGDCTVCYEGVRGYL